MNQSGGRGGCNLHRRWVAWPARLAGMLVAMLGGFDLPVAKAGELVAARQQLAAAVQRLEKSLAANAEQMDAWRSALDLADLEAAIQQPDPLPPDFVARVLRRVSANHPSLTWPPVVHLRQALAAYRDALLEADPPMALPDWIATFAPEFRAPTSGDVESARLRLWQALDGLHRSLAHNPDYRSRWKRYLRWNDLVPQVQTGAIADWNLLDEIVAQFRSGAKGLERSAFLETAAALDQFSRLSRALHDPQMPEQYQQQLGQVADELRKPADQRNDQQMAVAVQWLDRFAQAPAITAAVRRRYGQNNLVIEIAGEWISRLGSRTVDRTEPVRDVILGTQIYGTGRTVGNVRVRLVENPHRAVIEAVMDAVNYSRNRGYNGPAIVYSRGQATLHGVVRVSITDQQIVATPADTNAQVRSQIVGTGSSRGGLIGKIVTRAAARRAPQQKSAGERVAEQHAEQRLADQLNEQFAEALANANRRLADEIRGPLLRHGNYPDRVHFATRRDALVVTACEQSPRGLGAGSPPPPLVPGNAVSVRLHESLVNNAAFDWLAGQRRSTQEVQTLLEEILQRPIELDSDRPVPDVFITFASEDPVRFSVDDNLLSITIRGDRYEVPDRADIVEWDITAEYRLEQTDEGYFAQRTGPLQAYPRDWERGGRPLDLRRQLMRSALMRLMTPRFKESIPIGAIELRDQLRQHGPLTPHQVEGIAGWLVLGWGAPAGR